jgi:hypothetical protein
MFFRTKKLFQLSLITIFTTVFFLGIMGANPALAFEKFLVGDTVIKETCHKGIEKPIKKTIKSAFRMSLFVPSTNLKGANDCGNFCITPFPDWDDIKLDVLDFNGPGTFITFFGLTFNSGKAGTAWTNNLKSGTFQAFLDNSPGIDVGIIQMSLSGKLVVFNGTGIITKIVGKITGHDSAANCTYTGKFKGVEQIN